MLESIMDLCSISRNMELLGLEKLFASLRVGDILELVIHYWCEIFMFCMLIKKLQI